MADTLGGVIDKLCTADLKMSNQRVISEVGGMSFEDFKAKYCNEDGFKQIWKELNNCSDLDAQKSKLINEIDEKITEMIETAKSGENLDNGKYLQRSHKTY